jgi:hypothetical protein
MSDQCKYTTSLFIKHGDTEARRGNSVKSNQFQKLFTNAVGEPNAREKDKYA